MPADQVMHKFKHGQLHSGSKTGPVVKSRKQAIAIMESEKRQGYRAGTSMVKPLTRYQETPHTEKLHPPVKPIRPMPFRPPPPRPVRPPSPIKRRSTRFT